MKTRRITTPTITRRGHLHSAIRSTRVFLTYSKLIEWGWGLITSNLIRPSRTFVQIRGTYKYSMIADSIDINLVESLNHFTLISTGVPAIGNWSIHSLK